MKLAKTRPMSAATEKSDSARPRRRGGMTRCPTPVDADRWMLYLLRCRDGSLYAGITIDLARRVAQHEGGTASRYTRSRRPVALVYRESCASRSDALKREYAVKALTRDAKERLIKGASRADPRSPRDRGSSRRE
jgi:predicted GIY-YIG superfamily endonuclease